MNKPSPAPRHAIYGIDQSWPSGHFDWFQRSEPIQAVSRSREVTQHTSTRLATRLVEMTDYSILMISSSHFQSQGTQKRQPAPAWHRVGMFSRLSPHHVLRPSHRNEPGFAVWTFFPFLYISIFPSMEFRGEVTFSAWESVCFLFMVISISRRSQVQYTMRRSSKAPLSMCPCVCLLSCHSRPHSLEATPFQFLSVPSFSVLVEKVHFLSFFFGFLSAALAQGWTGLVFIHLTAEVRAGWTEVWT